MAFLYRLLLIAAGMLLGVGLVELAARYPYPALLVALYAVWRWHRRPGPPGWVHGTARLSGWADVVRRRLAGEDGLILGDAGYLDPPGWRLAIGQLLTARPRDSLLAMRLFLGRLWSPGWCQSRLIRVHDYVHLATFASTGGGKGVSVVLPTLLAYPGSVCVTDPKSENVHESGEHRRRTFGHRIVKLEPFGTDSDTFNVLDTIDETAPDFIDQCRDLAVALVPRTGRETENHFLDSAEGMLQAFIAFVCACQPDREQRNLQTVRKLLADRGRYDKCVKIMQEAGDVAGGMLQRLGERLGSHVDKELASCLSTVQRTTGFLDSPLIARNTLTSSFDPMELRNGKTSLYLCLPPERLESHAAVLRMWINCIMRTITRGGGDESNRVLFILDEIGNVGRLPILESAVTVMRGVGVRLWFIFQSEGQVKECFGDKAQTFLDCIATKQYFAIRSYETCESISRQAGDVTVPTTSEQDGTSDSRPTGGGPNGPGPGSFGRSSSLTTSEIARKLMQPNEIRTMPDDMALVFHQNMHVLPVRRIKYYAAPEFKRGRCGRSRGLGLAGLLMVVATLLLSVVLPAVSVALIEFARKQAAPALRAAAGQPGSRRSALPYGTRYRPFPASRNRLRRYPGGYGGN